MFSTSEVGWHNISYSDTDSLIKVLVLFRFEDLKAQKQIMSALNIMLTYNKIYQHAYAVEAMHLYHYTVLV